MKENLTEINTILDLLRWTSSQFNASEIFYGHGTDNFWDETLHLVLTSLHLPINIPTEIYHARITKKERVRIVHLVNQRTHAYIPVPYLTKKAWFSGLEFYVDKRVFIPRSPIGELIISHFHKLLPYTPHRILDMCTGCGCIAIATAIIYPHSEIDAVDISTDALTVAEYNIQLYNLENRIIPIYSNLFQDIPKSKYDLIITNPPYVNNIDIRNLPKEFHHEPILSLSADNNGLSVIQQILINAIHYLKPDGILICEVGASKNPLIQSYPNIPFKWITLTNGGDGVFILNYQQLLLFHKNHQLNN